MICKPKGHVGNRFRDQLEHERIVVVEVVAPPVGLGIRPIDSPRARPGGAASRSDDERPRLRDLRLTPTTPIYGMLEGKRALLWRQLPVMPTRLFSILVGVLAISACSGIGAGPSLAQPDAFSWSPPHSAGAKGDRLYVSVLPSVAGYAASGNRHRSVCRASLPADKYDWGGIGVSAAHVLYVPVASLDTIFTLTANCKPAGPSLSDPGGVPSDVAFDDKLGIVYVSNFAHGCVEVYEHGATSPTRQLCEAGFNTSYAVAVREGDVYATIGQLCDGSMYECTYLVKYPHGRQKGAHVLPLNEGYFRYTVGITFDLKGDLLAFSPLGYALIYPPPYQGEPGRWCTLRFQTNYGALDGSNKRLYVGATITGPGVEVYSYPSCTYKYFISFRGGGAAYGIGVAVDPQSGS